MKHIYLILLLLTISRVKAIAQLNYAEVDDLNTLCKKEDFEAVKIFLKNNGYNIYKDNENYDHGSYFVLAEIQAKIKLGERNNQYSKGTELDNIYDKIEIIFYEYNDYKRLTISQDLDYANSILYTSNVRKFGPLFQWLNEDWDFIKVANINSEQDSTWKKGYDGKINSESYHNYFSSKKFTGKNFFDVTFIKYPTELGEKKEYGLVYHYDDKPYEWDRNKPRLSISSGIRLETEIDKGANPSLCLVS